MTATAESTASTSTLIDQLRHKYPLTVANFEAMPDGVAALYHAYGLNQTWRRHIEQQRSVPAVISMVNELPTVDGEFEVIFAGAGLGLLDAALMATLGRKVLVFDRKQIGATHREWNISTAELNRLVRLGLFTWAELEPLIQRRYHTGIVRFAADTISAPSADLKLTGVLDLALDASGLLALCVQKIERSGTGSRILASYGFKHAYVQAAGRKGGRVVVEVEAVGGFDTCRFSGRLLIDDMGSTSPLAQALNGGRPFNAVCPTVGTSARGFVQGSADDEVDPGVGDVLVSVADAQGGRQLIWEGFPGRDDEMTTYVFYYDDVEAGHEHDLLALFEDYFRLLPTYKRIGSDFEHLRPVYGFIPARHREGLATRQGTGAADRILSIGDAAAQQSPLTFCGFGSHVRNLGRIASLLDLALKHDLLDKETLARAGAQQQNLGMMWVFSRFMSPTKAGLAAGKLNEVNQIMNIFCRVLNDLGPDLSRRFFQDTTTLSDYTRVTLHTLRVYPRILPLAFSVLGAKRMALWGVDYLAAFRAEAGRRIFRNSAKLLGADNVLRLEAALLRIAPRLGLRLRAVRLGWAVQREVTRVLTAANFALAEAIAGELASALRRKRPDGV